MTVIKRQRADKFAVVPNEVANDDRLSFEARGLLVYLLAKPNDWVVSITDLQKQGQIGRDKTYKLLNELIDVGYVERVREIDARTHRVIGFDYTIYDVAVQTTLPLPAEDGQEPLPEEPEVAFPLPCLPDPSSPETGNQDTIERTDLNKQTPQPPLPGGLEVSSIWEAWPLEHRGNHENVAGSWGRMSQDEQEAALRAAPVTVTAFRLRKQRLPALVRFLRERLYVEFDGAPELDFDGDFVLKPGMPEWNACLGAIRAKHGEKGVQSAVKSGFQVRRSRWPEGHPNYIAPMRERA